MVHIVPFRGLLYNSNRISNISKVVAPPYDVISPEEQENLYRRSPHNIVRLILNREPNPYEPAGQRFKRWQQEGVLVREEQRAIYFLRQRFRLRTGEEKERLGFFALVRLEDPSGGNIHPHERTLEGPKEDRLRLMLACHANFSAIFALYAEPKQTINRVLAEYTQGAPPSVTTQDASGAACQLWSIADAEIISVVQRTMINQPLLIADGHHLFEAYLKYREHRSRERSNPIGREAFNFFLMHFANTNDDGLVILPTHRLVRGFTPIPFRRLEELLQKCFYIEPYPKTRDGQRDFLNALKKGRRKRGLIGATFSSDPRYLILRLKSRRTMQKLAPEMSASMQDLDVSILHRLILQHILGLGPETQVQPGVIRYLEDEEEALRSVDEERDQAAFILNPPEPEQVFSVALQGERMPQKTTFFYPKLLSGLVINKIDPDEEFPPDPQA